MNVDMLLSLSSDIQSNIKMASSKSDSDFLSVLDLELNSEGLESVVNEDEKIDEQVLQILSLLLTKINTNEKLLEQKETTDIPIKNENKENSEVKRLKDIVLALSSEIQSNIKVESSKSELDYLAVVDNELLTYVFEKDTENREYINKVINEVINNNKNENKINALSNNITNIIEDLDINNDVENINKVITKNANKENYAITTLNTTREILFEVNKLKDCISYNNEFLENNSDELNILNSIAFSENNNKNIQLQKSIIRNKYELDNELDLVNTINFSSNNSDIQFEEVYIEQSAIREENVTKDVVQTVKYLKNNNIEELSVKMNPKELGEINIKLLKIDGEEQCVITLSKEDTFNLLKDNINEIKNHLNILDIKVKEISIEIRSENQSDFSDSLNQNSNKNNTKEEKKNSNKVIIEDIDNYLDNDDININLLV